MQMAALAATIVSSSDSAASSGISQLRASRLEVVAGEAGDLVPINCSRDGEPEKSASRLVFQVLPRVLPMHLPDDRLLVSGQHGGSGGSVIVTGSAKSARNDSFVPMAQAVSAPAAGKGKKAQLGGRLTAATLRRMMAAVAAPAGAHVRRRANAKAIAARLARYGALVAASSVAGWVAGRARREAMEQVA
jgi:hypothetical protein